MIIGNCPYCDGNLWTPIAPKCPVFSKEICEHCGKQHWLYHSRIDPTRYTLEGFADEWEVDEDKREITARRNEPATETSAE